MKTPMRDWAGRQSPCYYGSATAARIERGLDYTRTSLPRAGGERAAQEACLLCSVQAEVREHNFVSQGRRLMSFPPSPFHLHSGRCCQNRQHKYQAPPATTEPVLLYHGLFCRQIQSGKDMEKYLLRQCQNKVQQ